MRLYKCTPKSHHFFRGNMQKTLYLGQYVLSCPSEVDFCFIDCLLVAQLSSRRSEFKNRCS